MNLEPEILDAEAIVSSYAHDVLAPAEGECLACYVERQLTAFACDGSLRFATLFRDTVAPRSTALERRLEGMGGFCDCEILMNAFGRVDASGIADLDADDVPVRPCAGVRRGSAQPCSVWGRWRRGW
ncbi:DUF2695 domain-containing protein [Microbacterium gorillae]|uniref:DUF2695 domain-containing protein n=1 Tax=Microbacterium gorillae TaxID=1231063 RepID=UPI0006943AFC|nr:DUF2695 domain-containing protein [Microbacterium gorillae]